MAENDEELLLTRSFDYVPVIFEVGSTPIVIPSVFSGQIPVQRNDDLREFNREYGRP